MNGVLISEIIRTLEPVANMHRLYDDPDRIALSRGIASDMTILTQGDFMDAKMLVIKMKEYLESERIKHTVEIP